MKLDCQQTLFLISFDFHSSYNKHPYPGTAAGSNVGRGTQ